jgi:DeoR family transcriptional regulator, aga operon transcriptional repressor
MKSKISVSDIERKGKLLRFIEEQQNVTVREIGEQFSVSEATVRRDLDLLAGQGQIQRVHGGAMAVRRISPEPPIINRTVDHAEEKKSIGALVADLLRDKETIFLGSGTTVAEVAKHIKNNQNLTIITNSLPVINTLADVSSIEVIALGGLLRHSEYSLIGHIAEQSTMELRADRVIMGIRAIDIEHGLTNDYLAETMTDRAILKLGREVILVADHSKCCRISSAFVASLSAIHTFVTDSGTPLDFLNALKARGINVLVA